MKKTDAVRKRNEERKKEKRNGRNILEKKMDTGGKTEPNKKQVNRKPTNREEKV